MLKKLFAHEWKDTWKIVGCMNLAVIILTIIGTLTINEDAIALIETNEYASVTFGLYIMFYFVAVMALSLTTTFYFFYRFYKNLYTDEGYLMHTLPVKSHHLVWSKTFVAIIWQFISGIVVIFSFLSFMDCMYRIDGNSAGSFWAELGVGISEVFDVLFNGSGYEFEITILLIEVILMLLISPFFAIFLGYASISLGQLAKKRKLMASVGAYFGISILLQWIISFATVPFVSFTYRIEAEQETVFFLGIYGVICVIYAAVTAAFYFLTNHIMRNKLNLE